MRNPSQLTAWFSPEELLAWVQESDDKASYQKRLAIWLTHAGPLHAADVARYLGVSKHAVWLWLGQYNHGGPSGLDRVGRGGRRWSFLSPEEEGDLLLGFLERASRGEVVTALHLHRDICRRVGREVSMAYVYKLLRRNQWRKLAPRPHHPKADAEAREAFKKTFRKS
jgi:transposase